MVLLPDNTAACCDQLFDFWNKAYTENCKKDAVDLYREFVRFILEKSILCDEDDGDEPVTVQNRDKHPIVDNSLAIRRVPILSAPKATKSVPVKLAGFAFEGFFCYKRRISQG